MDIIEMEIIGGNESFESEVDFRGEYINTLTKEQIQQALQEFFKQNDVIPKPTINEVTLFADKWIGNGRRFEQVVEVSGIKESTQVDLTPSEEQLDIFYDKKVMLSTRNVGGVVTVTLIGQKLENDYTIQVTLTEVEYE